MRALWHLQAALCCVEVLLCVCRYVCAALILPTCVIFQFFQQLQPIYAHTHMKCDSSSAVVSTQKSGLLIAFNLKVLYFSLLAFVFLFLVGFVSQRSSQACFYCLSWHYFRFIVPREGALSSLMLGYICVCVLYMCLYV